MAQMHASKKKRFDDDDGEILVKVSSREITQKMLSEKLGQHVQQVRSKVTWSFAHILETSFGFVPFKKFKMALGLRDYKSEKHWWPVFLRKL